MAILRSFHDEDDPVVFGFISKPHKNYNPLGALAKTNYHSGIAKFNRMSLINHHAPSRP